MQWAEVRQLVLRLSYCLGKSKLVSGALDVLKVSAISPVGAECL